VLQHQLDGRIIHRPQRERDRRPQRHTMQRKLPRIAQGKRHFEFSSHYLLLNRRHETAGSVRIWLFSSNQESKITNQKCFHPSASYLAIAPHAFPPLVSSAIASRFFPCRKRTATDVVSAIAGLFPGPVKICSLLSHTL